MPDMEYSLSYLCQNLERYIRDYERSFPGLSKSLALLSSATLGSADGGASCERQSLPSVVLLESLSRPLAIRKAAEEKLEACQSLASAMAEDARRGLVEACFSSSSSSSADGTRHLALRAMTSLLRIWGSTSESESDRVKKWPPPFKSAVEWACDRAASDDVARRFLASVLDAKGVARRCLPKKVGSKVWAKAVAKEGSHSTSSSFPSGEELFSAALRRAEEEGELAEILRETRKGDPVSNKKNPRNSLYVAHYLFLYNFFRTTTTLSPSPSASAAPWRLRRLPKRSPPTSGGPTSSPSCRGCRGRRCGGGGKQRRTRGGESGGCSG